MKGNRVIRYILLAAGVIVACTALHSQEGERGAFRSGADLYSSYLWRGSNLGSGPSVQPVVEYSSGLFNAGAWGAFDFDGYKEADLYISFSFPAGLSIGLTDYYSPGLRYFDYTTQSGSHAFELNLGYSIRNFSLSANYIFNEAGGIGSVGNDLYFEAGYSFEPVTIFLGAGNGWHNYNSETGESRFDFCNAGIEVSRTIRITETYGIPVTGQVILNPAQERMFVVVGFTL